MLLIPEVLRIESALLKCNKGQGLMEYVLILSLVSIAAVIIMTALGVNISSLVSLVEGKI